MVDPQKTDAPIRANEMRLYVVAHKLSVDGIWRLTKGKRMKLVSQKRVDLKESSDFNEKAIQDYIYENPQVLGLGELEPRMKEKTLPLGGRLDMLFSDEEGNRYEVELQLGATDESHIIRTIEYWDIERKRYPQYDHIAVIIAENITSRFQNVISLFNGQIPLIAIQMVATQTESGDVALTFVKVMDRVIRGTEEEEAVETADRAYWEKKSSKAMLELTDAVFTGLEELTENYALNYTRTYIGMAHDGLSHNFVVFYPGKKSIAMAYIGEYSPELYEKYKQAGLEPSYRQRESRYFLRFSSLEDFEACKDDILEQVKAAKER